MHRGATAPRPPPGRRRHAPAAGDGGGLRHADRRRAAGGPRERNHPPRHQVGQHHGHRQGPGEADGLRAGEDHGPDADDAPGFYGGNGGVHVARTGAGRGGGPPLGHLVRRRCVLRDGQRTPAVPGRLRAGRHLFDSERRAGAVDGAPYGRAGGVGRHRDQGAGQGPGDAISACGRAAGGPAGHVVRLGFGLPHRACYPPPAPRTREAGGRSESKKDALGRGRSHGRGVSCIAGVSGAARSRRRPDAAPQHRPADY